MGGTVRVTLSAGNEPDDPGRACCLALRRIEAWSDRLTRFSSASELSRLNRDPRPRVPVGPTLAAVLDWGRTAEVLTGGVVDVAMLDARLAAEEGRRPVAPRDGRPVASGGSRSWSLKRGGRRTCVVRPPGLRFDLDGVAKGWIADRALALVRGSRVAAVDADGDVAVRLAPGERIEVGVADPRAGGTLLATLRLVGRGDGFSTRLGVATSGTSVHRWPDRAFGGSPSGPRHHLIDPRTGLPALTDVVQATVLADRAREAEAFAKAAVIVGTAGAVGLLAHQAVRGAILLTEGGDVLGLPGIEGWLA